MTERTSIWLLIVLPTVVAALLLVPVMCGGGAADCVRGAPCPPSTTTCFSLVGVPTNGLAAAAAVATVGAFGTALYLRWVGKRSRE